MKTITKTMLLSCATLLMLAGTAFKHIQPKLDFSGKWSLNKEKSDFGTLPQERAAPVSIRIVQKKDSIRIERAFVNQPLSTETFSFDGKTLELSYPGTTVTRVLSWSGDGKTITIASKYKMHRENEPQWEYTRTEIYTMAEGNKTLVLERESITPQATEKVKAIYNKE